MVNSRGSGASSSVLSALGILRRGKDGVVQPMAPFLDLLLDPLRTDDRTTVGQVHVVFEIPSEVFEITLAEERGECRGNANSVPWTVLKTNGERSVLSRSEQQAKLVVRRADRWHGGLPFSFRHKEA